MYNNSFQTLYQTHLKPGLSKLKSRHRLVVITGLITRLVEIYFLTVVISLFLGFLNMFSMDDLDSSLFVRGIKGFMYFVLGIVVLGLVNKQVKQRLGEKNTELLKNGFLVYGLTLLIGAVVIFCAYNIGINYLGAEFNAAFMWRWAGGIFSVFLLIIPYNLLKKVETNYNNSYKKILINECTSLIADDIIYSEQEWVPENEFISSKLFTFQNIYDFRGSDLFKRNAHNFHGSKLKVSQKEVTQSNGKTEVKISEIFNGFLFIADFNKTFHGETYIFPDLTRAAFGEVYGESINEHIHRPKLQLVKLEDPNFEKLFAVYATDPIEARYILSTKLVERITEMKKIFYQDISLSFVENKLYIAISSEGELFAPGLFTSVDSEAFLEKQFSYLNALLTIPEKFDLKTRIWN